MCVGEWQLFIEENDVQYMHVIRTMIDIFVVKAISSKCDLFVN